jgi:hypothetical protein
MATVHAYMDAIPKDIKSPYPVIDSKTWAKTPQVIALTYTLSFV